MTAHDSAPAPASRRAAVRAREDVVVDRLGMLATAVDGEPSPEFRAATRARLVAMAAVRQPAPAPASWARRLVERRQDRVFSAWRARLTAGLAGAALAVTALAALVAVSTGARPGDALYGLKRGTEQTQLALAGDSTRGRTLLGFAGTRLRELQDLVRQGATAAPAGPGTPGQVTVDAAGASPSLVIETLATMDQQTTEGAYWVTTEAARNRDDAALAFLSTWVAGQNQGLTALVPQLPAQAQPAAQKSLALLAVVGSRGTALTPVLDCATGPATAGTDRLGPVPATCPAAPVAPSPATGSGTQQSQPGNTDVTVVPGAPTLPSGLPPATSSNGLPLPLPGGTGSGTGPGGLGVTTSPTPGLPLPSIGTQLTPVGPILPAQPAPTASSTSSTTSPTPTSSLPGLPLSTCALGLLC